MLINIVKSNAMLLVYASKLKNVLTEIYYPHVLFFLSARYTDDFYMNKVWQINSDN